MASDLAEAVVISQEEMASKRIADTLEPIATSLKVGGSHACPPWQWFYHPRSTGPRSRHVHAYAVRLFHPTGNPGSFQGD